MTGKDEEAFRRGITVGCAMSIAHMLRSGAETCAEEWWQACGLSMAELEWAVVDDYDLEPIRQAGLEPDPINLAGSGPTPIAAREG